MGERQGNRWATDPKLFAGMVGEAVRRHRQSAGYTQVQLAEAAGLSPNYVARLERGELGPSLFVAHLLARPSESRSESSAAPPSRPRGAVGSRVEHRFARFANAALCAVCNVR